MQRTALVLPELPGKDAKSIPAMCKARGEEYRSSRARAKVTMERVYRMATPMGVFVTAYIESERSFAETMGGFMTSGLKFDADFLQALHDVHGLDTKAPPPGPPPEVLDQFWDPNVKQRGRGLAFAAPLLPGVTAAGREFTKTAFTTRVAEFATSRRAQAINGEVVVLNSTPHGDMICVYIEGKDPVAGNAGFAASRSAYDVWFKAECRKLFPPNIDFDNPLPPIEELWDWQA